MANVLAKVLLNVAKELTVGHEPCVSSMSFKLHYGVTDDIHMTEVIDVTLEPTKEAKYEVIYAHVKRFVQIATHEGPKEVQCDDHEYGTEELEDLNG